MKDLEAMNYTLININGVGAFVTLQGTLIVLKFLAAIDWDWLYVLMPAIILLGVPLAFALCLLICSGILLIIFGFINYKEKKQ